MLKIEGGSANAKPAMPKSCRTRKGHHATMA
jgi:hypothetical protein